MKLAVMTRSAALFRLICRSFEAEGTVCSQFCDDVALARAVDREDIGAILIDADTGMNPLRPILARRACYADRRIPLIVIGARAEHPDIAGLLDTGADDVVLAPVDARELTLRVRIAQRRLNPATASDASNRLECDAYVLDRSTCMVTVAGTPAKLTAREFAIAWLLFSHAGEYVSRRQIAGAVWSSSEDIVGRTLEQHIYKLRKKLDLNGLHGIHLRTMYAYGYRVEITGVQSTPAQPVGIDATAGTDDSRVACPADVKPLQLTALAMALVSHAASANGHDAADGHRHNASRAALHSATSETARLAHRWPDTLASTPPGRDDAGSWPAVKWSTG